MDINVTYTIKLNDTTIVLTGEEAKELYTELAKIFVTDSLWNKPSPMYGGPGIGYRYDTIPKLGQ